MSKLVYLESLETYVNEYKEWLDKINDMVERLANGLCTDEDVTRLADQFEKWTEPWLQHFDNIESDKNV